jgi:hypothetical protein
MASIDFAVMNKEPQLLLGVLSLQRLFVGSKSEGMYPVFDAEDGTRYRVRLQGDAPTGADPLAPYFGQRVKVSCATDRLRGHWRMTIHTSEVGLSGIEMVPIDSEGEV